MRLVLVMLCLLVNLSACNTMNGIGRDVAHVGDGLSNMAR